MSDRPSSDGIMQLAFGFWSSKTLLSAVELGLFSELGKEPLTLEQVRSRLGMHRRGARDFLDALVALGMLNRKGDIYSNTIETALYLDRAKPTYIGACWRCSVPGCSGSGQICLKG